MSTAGSTRAQASSVRAEPEHDFAAKLRQPSILPQVLDYVAWQRAVREAVELGKPKPEMPRFAPISINLDITTACNYACPHCIDMDILNSPVKYDFDRLKASMTHLARHGMKSVIMIGGGEPTLHKGFPEMVRHLKDLGLQVAIVSNGARNHVLFEIIEYLDERDWIRLSLDSGSDETFQTMHLPKNPITLDEICEWVPKLRAKNSAPLIGFSYIIVWGNAEQKGGAKIVSNVHEIVMAAKRARRFNFSYISFKPFLTRKDGGAEVMDAGAITSFEDTVYEIRAMVDEAKTCATPDFEVIESVNLKLLEDGNWRDFTNQPQVCHMQALRQVLSPLGLFNCPAHRGVSHATISGKHAYSDENEFRVASKNTEAILDRFDASHECREVTCLYNSANWWIDQAIRGQLPPEMQGALEERYDYYF